MFSRRTRRVTAPVEGSLLWAEARAAHEAGEEKKSFELYKRAADAGFPKALNSMGVCYMTGFGQKGKCDPVRAVDFFERGAEAADVSAALNYGKALSNGDGIEKNGTLAFEWLMKASVQGDSEATFLVAVALLDGRGVEKDPFKARNTFAALVEQEYLQAFSYLGVCCLQGVGGAKKDNDKAAELFGIAAQRGDPRGMYYLALFYQNGLGIEADLKKSLELHVKAWSEKGYLDSFVMLGVFYLNGISVLVDEDRAFEIFTKAAESGNVLALNYTGMCHLMGIGTTKNAKKALKYYEMAANQHDATGLVHLANFYLTGNGTEKNVAKARMLLREAVGLGSSDGMVSLALSIVGEDLSQAIELVARASEKKNAKALFIRAQWFEEGTLIPKDINLALQFYRKALLIGHKQAGEKYRALIVDTLPESIKRGGKKQIDLFVEDIVEAGNMVWNQAKIMVLGKEGVGKTALYHKIRNLAYPKNLSTDGIDVHLFQLNDMELVWFDFGGQTIFYPTHQFFLTARCIYLLCFKFGDEGSIERVKYWLQDVQYLTRDPTRPLKILVVGTHADEMPDEAAQQIVWDSLKKSIDSIGHVVGYLSVSSEDGTGVEGLRRGIELAITASKLKAVQVPKSYKLIERFIKEMRKKMPRMDWTDVNAAFPALTERHLEMALEFFTDMGLCVFDQRLKILVFDPQWLAKTFSSLISFSHQWVRDGVVKLQDLRHVWKELDDSEIAKLMFLFEKFGVAFLKRKEGYWVVPTLLSNDSSVGEFQWESGKNGIRLHERVFRLEFIPFGLFGRLIARLQSWCEDDARVIIINAWQTGVVLQEAGHMANVYIDATRNALVIRVVSTVKSQVLSPPASSWHRGHSDHSRLRVADFARMKTIPKADAPPPSNSQTSSELVSPAPVHGLDISSSVSSSNLKFHSTRSTVINVPQMRSSPSLTGRPSSNDNSSSTSCNSTSPRSWARVSEPRDPEIATSRRSPRAGALRSGSHVGSGSSTISRSTNFVKKLVEHVSALLSAIFEASSGVEIVISVACPHCINDPIHQASPTYFSMSDCIDAVVSANSVLLCRGEPIEVDLLDDDITFRYVTVFTESDVVLEQEPFAAGGFGSIFKGSFSSNGKFVVAKELKPEKAKEAFAELQHETSVMSDLQHPNLLQLYGVMLHPLRMILEYCGDGDLIHGLRKGWISSDALRYKLSLDIAQGLCFLHEQKPPIAHCDLRSPNVLLVSLDPSSSVCAKVCDFGLSMSVIERMRNPLPTWQWMAPEAQMGDYYTEACDLYSLGIILWEIFNGKGDVPFSEFTTKMRVAEMFPLIREGTLRPSLNEKIQPWMESMIERLWSTSPSVRPSARQCVTSMIHRATLSHAGYTSPSAMNELQQKWNIDVSEYHTFKVACASIAVGKMISVASTDGNFAMIDPLSGKMLFADKIFDATAICNQSSNVWVGRCNGEISCINKETGKDVFFFVENWELSGSITWIASMSLSQMLVTDDRGFVCLVGLAGANVEHPRVLMMSKVKDPIVCGCLVNEKLVWLCGKSTIFSVAICDAIFDVSVVDSLPDCGVIAIAFVGGAEMWVLCSSTLYIYIQGKQRFQFLVNPSFCISVVQWNGMRTVWIGQVDAISVWDLRRRQLAKLDMIEAGKVRCIAQDTSSNGVVWIGAECEVLELRST